MHGERVGRVQLVTVSNAEMYLTTFTRRYKVMYVVIMFPCHDERITSTILYELIHIFLNGCLAKHELIT